MNRGELWWADLPKPAGRRPVLLLSRNVAIQVRKYVTVAQVTTVVRNLPVEVPLTESEGMPRACVVNLDVINTIPKSLLKKPICKLHLGKMRAVEQALRFALQLD